MIKKYLEFIKESNSWSNKSMVNIDGKDYIIKWGSGELELSEIHQVFHEKKNLIPKEWEFKSIFDKSYPEEFSSQRDTKPSDIKNDLTSEYPSGNVTIKYTSSNLLKMDELTVDGKKVDAKPYHEFIKKVNEFYWKGSNKQLSEAELNKLANDVGYEEGRTSFTTIINDKTYMGKLKTYFDKVVKSEENPDGVPIKRFGTKKVKMDYPDLWDEYQRALEYYEYFQKTFDYVGGSIKKGEVLAPPSVLNIGGKMVLLGGNRRITYCILNNISPTVHYIKY